MPFAKSIAIISFTYIGSRFKAGSQWGAYVFSGMAIRHCRKD
jgi:hypothetical protein